MAVIDRMHDIKPRFLSPSAFRDFAGNKFLAVIVNNGTDQATFVRVYKRTPAGLLSTVGEYQSIEGKEDACCIYQDGADCAGFVTAHPADTDTNIQDFVFRNVCVPYPTNAPPPPTGTDIMLPNVVAGVYRKVG